MCDVLNTPLLRHLRWGQQLDHDLITSSDWHRRLGDQIATTRARGGYDLPAISHHGACPKSCTDLYRNPGKYVPRGSGRDRISPQKGLGLDIHEREYQRFLTEDVHTDSDNGQCVDAELLARTISGAGPGASQWHALPVDEQSTHTNAVFTGILRRRLHVPDFRVLHTGLICTCRHGGKLTQHHLQSCGRTGWNTTRHNNVVRNIANMARDCECTVVVETKWEVNQRGDPDTGRMDLLITTPESKRIAIDVTVVSPTRADDREGAAAIRAERAKDHLP
jgi:hypothetical protein